MRLPHSLVLHTYEEEETCLFHTELCIIVRPRSSSMERHDLFLSLSKHWLRGVATQTSVSALEGSVFFILLLQLFTIIWLKPPIWLLQRGLPCLRHQRHSGELCEEHKCPEECTLAQWWERKHSTQTPENLNPDMWGPTETNSGYSSHSPVFTITPWI